MTAKKGHINTILCPFKGHDDDPFHIECFENMADILSDNTLNNCIDILNDYLWTHDIIHILKYNVQNIEICKYILNFANEYKPLNNAELDILIKTTTDPYILEYCFENGGKINNGKFCDFILQRKNKY